jgi:hypothetical protein
MSMSLANSNLVNDYYGIGEQNRSRVRELCGQMTRNNVDGSTALIESMRKLTGPEVSAQTGNPNFQRKLDSWFTDYANQNLAHRRNMARMLSNLKVIANDQPGLESVAPEIDRISERNLNESNFPIGYINPNEGKAKMNDLLKVVNVNTQKPMSHVSHGVPTRATTSGYPSHLTPPRSPNLGRGDSRSRLITVPGTPEVSRPSMSISNYTPSAPKYYRIDEHGNRIQIDKPVAGTPIRRSNSVLSHPITHSPHRSPIRTTLPKSPSQPLLGMTMTPSRSQPTLLSTVGTPGPERRMLFTDPQTGQKMIKVTSPGGRTVLKIEPYRDSHSPSGINRSSYSPSGQYNLTQPSTGFVRPVLPSQTTTLRTGRIPTTSDNISMQARRMIDDATSDFANPEIEDFDCDDCKIWFDL